MRQLHPAWKWMSFAVYMLLIVSGCSSTTGRQADKPTPIAAKQPALPQPKVQRPQTDAVADFIQSGTMTALPLRFLVLGLDASQMRSDVILAVTVPESGPVSVVSIPRDTRVAMPAGGYGKINQVYAHGGAAATEAQVSQLLGQHYTKHVALTFTGLERLVNALGGVPMQVARPMQYTDKAGGLDINIKAGNQTLDGKQAVHFVRYRADGRGDIGRISRQQQFMQSWLSAIRSQPTALLRLREGLPTGVNTNLPLVETLRLVANLAISRRPVNFTLLPGQAAYVDSVSYWLPGN